MGLMLSGSLAALGLLLMLLVAPVVVAYLVLHGVL
jgi:hypothetical protein